MNAHRGFTLIELMVTIAVAAIILTMGVPSFINIIRNNRVATETNRIMAAVQFARSEAIKRNQTVTICRSGNGSTCGTGTSANVYENGWLVYNDFSDSSPFNGNADYNSSEDTLIRVGEAAGASMTIRSNTMGNQWLSFRPNGRLAETGDVIYAVCFNGASTAAVPGRLVTLDLRGRATITTIAAGGSCTPS